MLRTVAKEKALNLGPQATIYQNTELPYAIAKRLNPISKNLTWTQNPYILNPKA